MSILGPRVFVAVQLLLVMLLATPAGVTGSATAPAKAPPTLVDIRAAHYQGYDRIVFEFEGGRPGSSRLRWADGLRLDPSDKPANVQGNAFLKATFRWAVAHEPVPPAASTFGPARRAFDLPNVAQVVLLGDYEGVVTFGIGLMKRTRILQTIELSHPYRFVVHVATGFAQRKTKVYFVDETATIEGREPSVAPVTRVVPKGRRAKSALQRLYAGPTQGELAAGLRLVASGTTGFRDLRIDQRRVARVTLRGRCDSGGSALVTVASQIMPTLRSLPAVDWVKLYDQQGQTEQPWGRTDSIPACLEP